MDDVTQRLADRLARIRAERNLSLDQLAALSGVSRATLSRLEKAEASPTTAVLSRLCAAYGLSLSQLMATVEDGFAAHIRRADQFVAREGGQGYVRRQVSPAGGGLAAEVQDCRLAADTELRQDAPSVPGQEHHLILTSGSLRVELDGRAHDLEQGDSLRYRPHGPLRIAAGPEVAKYLLIRVSH
ncbi:helix-turn-helix domain-containing protein [Thalassococcus sp. BH17M4-6]|uniref:helix-turn-helix domain-containing protein n=1 Tax=Thalassococcus sp. BH17M4-6 TaxID=3413148 RepID=UPI003BED1BF6